MGEFEHAVLLAIAHLGPEELLLNVNRERVTMIIGLVLGATSLLLSAVGLFSAMATLVGTRTREFGVRTALGAVPTQLAGLVLWTGLGMVLCGGLIGLGLAASLGRIVEARLYGVGAIDPASVLAAIGLVVAVSFVAAWLPARRAARVDPIEALRVE
jgi:putative ABC transport system permease protein